MKQFPSKKDCELTAKVLRYYAIKQIETRMEWSWFDRLCAKFDHPTKEIFELADRLEGGV